jgi:hypothetical protein
MRKKADECEARLAKDGLKEKERCGYWIINGKLKWN